MKSERARNGFYSLSNFVFQVLNVTADWCHKSERNIGRRVSPLSLHLIAAKSDKQTSSKPCESGNE